MQIEIPRQSLKVKQRREREDLILQVEEQIPPEELVKHLTRIYFQDIAAD